jgi:hypothetical protein
MNRDMQWRDDEGIYMQDQPRRTFGSLVLEAVLLLVVFGPVVWVTLAVVESFR